MIYAKYIYELCDSVWRMRKIERLSLIGDEIVTRAQRSDLYAKVVDDRGNVVGKITRILGPVKSPYGIVKLRTKEALNLELFIRE
jgi:rRNA processing protein Gar1